MALLAIDIYLQSGEDAYRAHNLEKAREMLARAISEARKHVKDHDTLGEILLKALQIAVQAEDTAEVEEGMMRIIGHHNRSSRSELEKRAKYNALMADYLKSESRPDEAIPFAEAALAAAENRFGPKSAQAAALMNNLAILYRRTGNPARAIPLQEKSLHIYTREVGEKSDEATQVRYNLGESCREAERLEEAAEYHRQVLVVREDAESPEPYLVVESLNALGAVLRDMGEYSDALVLFERALKLADAKLADAPLLRALLSDNMAQLFQERGDLARARELLQYAKSVYTEHLGPEDEQTIDVAKRFAAIEAGR